MYMQAVPAARAAAAARRSLLPLLLAGAGISTVVGGGANHAPPYDGYQCCWLGDADCGPSSSPSICPELPGCSTYAECTGPCQWRLPDGPAKWCQTSFDTPHDSASDPPLRQYYRPPRQTAAQAESMKDIEERAVKLSAEAEPWVLEYITSDRFRSHLDPSLHKFSGPELLKMMTWEFQRLPLFHNAPTDAWDVDRVGDRRQLVTDDSPMNIALPNGNLQQPCQRYVLGGPEGLMNTVMYLFQFNNRRMSLSLCLSLCICLSFVYTNVDRSRYANMYVNHFLLAAKNLCDLTKSLRKSNSCMMFNANNLRKTALGNIGFGSLTYVLDTNALAGRFFVEPFDGGAMELFEWDLWWKYPAQGTIFPPAWYHTLQPHERMMSAPFSLLHLQGSYKTLATTLNRWWVDGAAMPTVENSGSVFMDNAYFEVMTNGNVWLPEDLQQMQAKYSSDPPQGSGGGDGAEGIFGTQLGADLRVWLANHQRPLVWADRLDGPMLLDPIVASHLGVGGYGFSHADKITAEDVALFRRAWEQPAWNHSFDALVNEAAPHLLFKWQNFFHRASCAAAEYNASNHVMGIDGNGECVYWTSPNGGSHERQAWECLNDGTCSLAQLPSDRAIFATEADCLSECGSSWECVRDVPFAAYSGTAYCLPRVSNITPGVCGVDANTPCERFSSIDSCEASCMSGDTSRSFTCSYNWWDIICAGVAGLVVLRLSMICVAQRCSTGRQTFETQFVSCCRKPRQQVGHCLFVTCCPCFQWFRVMGFLLGQKCGLCGCVCFTLCGLCPPVALGYCAFNLLCGCCIDACTRFHVRRKLKIEGTFCQDAVIHMFATTCARNQEALEISSAGYSGTCYECASQIPL